MAVTVEKQMPGRYIVVGSKYRVADSFDELIDLLIMELGDRSQTMADLRSRVEVLTDENDDLREQLAEMRAEA